MGLAPQSPPPLPPTDIPPGATSSSLYVRAKNYLQSAAIDLLRSGPIPRHVGFIMDGNRRYARNAGVQTGVGHAMGSKKLEETLEWCLKLGVQVVTVYAFSIENFKRPAAEVDVIMDLASRKLEEFSTNSAFITKHSIRIKVLGDVSLLPTHVRTAAARAERSTRHHAGAVLNIACPYTSRHEMATAVALAARGVKEARLDVEDVDEELLDRLMMTGGDPQLDVLVRTSGEKRLSDFLLWQVSKSCRVHFLDVLWPDFTFWDMLPVLLAYQVHASPKQTLPSPTPSSASPSSTTQRSPAARERIDRYIQLLEREHFAET
ncbi:hypothetical protein HDU87_006441 [Geranomyces variabilis]|uniref:Alkyl transferase n=1 Tax=Geranomyces variabilis TaxID=109894 RepID=A0AAD5XKG2_9FUNG|nr:hypothetical protein HDU87_006441 [Geranomyces variabilis]